MNSRNSNILIVDDETVIRETIKKILLEEGFNVLSAGDGTSAIEIIKNNEIDIALLDIKMPDINGVELLEKIKFVKPAVKAVMMTGYEVESLINDAFRQGAYACLHKPFAIKKLLEIFDELGQENE